MTGAPLWTLQAAEARCTEWNFDLDQSSLPESSHLPRSSSGLVSFQTMFELLERERSDPLEYSFSAGPQTVSQHLEGFLPLVLQPTKNPPRQLVSLHKASGEG